jgi:hypothetical protein
VSKLKSIAGLNQTAMNQSPQQVGGVVNRGARKKHSFPVILTVGAVWLSLVLTGMGMMIVHSNTPGEKTVKLSNWPADSKISLDAGHLNLIMFAHPHCPCMRATLGELNQLMSDRPGKFTAQVWFIKPAGTADDWTDTDIWRQAAAIPGVTVHRDDTGAEARRFHARTSGETLLYDQKGQLMFAGGITLGRGHSGDNPGRSALEVIARQSLPNQIETQIETPVYGCALFEMSCSTNPTNCATGQNYLTK